MSNVTRFPSRQPGSAHRSTASAKPPKGLSASARKLWQSIIAAHVIDDELSRDLLEQLCRVHDSIRACECVVKREGMTVTNPASGRTVAHPLLAAVATQRAQYMQLVKALRLDLAQ